MPLDKIETTDGGALGLWRIDEDEASLLKQATLFEETLPSISNPSKRLEWLAGRVLVKTMMKEMKLPFRGITKNEFGKPFLAESSYQLALSHSYPYVAALLNQHEYVGLDLEQPKTKLLRIAPRVLDPVELQDAGEDVVKHCVYWCAKESLIKIYGKKDLTLSENLKIEPFTLAEDGLILGRIIASTMNVSIPLRYRVTEKFVLVWSIK